MLKLRNAIPHLVDVLLGTVTILGLVLLNLFLVCLLVKAVQAVWGAYA